jgi:hypothetical protein
MKKVVKSELEIIGKPLTPSEKDYVSRCIKSGMSQGNINGSYWKVKKQTTKPFKGGWIGDHAKHSKASKK